MRSGGCAVSLHYGVVFVLTGVMSDQVELGLRARGAGKQ